MKYEYPALFYDDDDKIAFHFYDREDWFLCGDNLFDAIEMAQDVLNGALLSLEREGKEIPPASKSLTLIILFANFWTAVIWRLNN